MSSMKKAMAALLCGVMLLGFSACGNAGTVTESASAADTTAAESEATTAAASEETTSEAVTEAAESAKGEKRT